MKIKSEFNLMNKLMRWPLMLLFIVGYSVIYGVIFGGIFGKDLDGIIYQFLLWTLLYGFMFLIIGNGFGIITLYYALISFSLSRRKVFRIWTKSLWMNIILGIITYVPFVLVWKSRLQKGNGVAMLFGIDFMEDGTKLWQVFFLFVGFSLLLTVMMALISTIGMRFGWQICLGSILVLVSSLVLIFIKNIDILFITGYNLNKYILVSWVGTIILYAITYVLTLKWEVKS